MKISPGRTDFAAHAKKHNLVVFSCKFFCDYLTPVSLFSRIKRLTKEESFLLESVEGEEKISRFSFIGCRPLATFTSKKRDVSITIEGVRRRFKTKKDPLSELRSLMKQFRLWPKEHIRFFGGFVGYLGYDAVRFYEPVGASLRDPLNTPDVYFILPKFLIIFDHLKKQLEVLSLLYLKEKRGILQAYNQEVTALRAFIDSILVGGKLSPLHIPGKNELPLLKGVTSNFKKREFTDAVKKTKRYIISGDAIQVVLSQRFSTPFDADPFIAYRYLRLLNPSPYMYYLNFRATRIVGSSPEMLLRCEGKDLTTRPIAGTRRRGRDDDEDRFLEKELLNDKKELAEHVMLVDLGRNDLGRASMKSTVHVPIFKKIERFSHVMHIVSEVRSRLSATKDMFDALRCCFPAGTVSGAPKVRAMQIINELESEQRGIYAGCIGYFSFTKSLDTCIIIRTIVFKNHKAHVQAGAGIVADSVPEREYKETVNKAKAQLLALQLAAEKR